MEMLLYDFGGWNFVADCGWHPKQGLCSGNEGEERGFDTTRSLVASIAYAALTAFALFTHFDREAGQVRWR